MSYVIHRLWKTAGRLGLSQADLAAMLGTTPGIVEAWLTCELAPRVGAQARLDGVTDVLEELSRSMAPTAARRWLVRPHPALDLETPFDLLTRGEHRYLRTVIVRALGRDRRPPRSGGVIAAGEPSGAIDTIGRLWISSRSAGSAKGISSRGGTSAGGAPAGSWE